VGGHKLQPCFDAFADAILTSFIAKLFARAGVFPGVPANRQRSRPSTDQERLSQPSRPTSKIRRHGHSPTLLMPERGRQPHVLRRRCNLDTGAVYGGPLSAAIFSDAQAQPSAIVTTEASANKHSA